MLYVTHDLRFRRNQSSRLGKPWKSSTMDENSEKKLHTHTHTHRHLHKWCRCRCLTSKLMSTSKYWKTVCMHMVLFFYVKPVLNWANVCCEAETHKLCSSASTAWSLTLTIFGLGSGALSLKSTQLPGVMANNRIFDSMALYVHRKHEAY